MPYNDLGFAHEGNLRCWTNSAIDCYYNGLKCNICVLPDDLKEQCKMKPCVLELVRKFGKPHKDIGKD